MKDSDASWICPNHPGLPGVSWRAVVPVCHRPPCDNKVRMTMVHSFQCDGGHETGPCRKGMDLEAIVERWCRQCGPCDYGLVEFGCTCPAGDYRLVILDLVREIERLRKEAGK